YAVGRIGIYFSGIYGDAVVCFAVIIKYKRGALPASTIKLRTICIGFSTTKGIYRLLLSVPWARRK
ncbi:MAG: hypothetical protein EA409_05515, partial [Saprospirales bacterium]